MKIACMLSWLFFSAQTIIGIYTLAGGDEFVKNAVIAILLASLKPDGKCLTVRSGACFLYKAEY